MEARLYGWNVEQVTVTADNQRLGLVIRSLLSNALSFTPRGGRIDVHVQVMPSGAGFELQVAVSDTGCGISQVRRGCCSVTSCLISGVYDVCVGPSDESV